MATPGEEVLDEDVVHCDFPIPTGSLPLTKENEKGNLNSLDPASNPPDVPPKSKELRPKNPRSIIYQFFEWVPKINQWKCLKCKRTYSSQKNGSTGNLINHIRISHPYLLKNAVQEETSEVQQSSYSIFKTGNVSSPPKKITKEGFRQKVIQHLVCSDQPFTLVEEKSFRDLICYVSGNNADTTLFCAKTAKSLITTMYNEEKQALKNLLSKNTSKISFVIDCWTSSNQIPFQGVVAKWITDDWELKSSVIDLTLLRGSHTGENIADAFCKVLVEFNLWNKLHSVTTDNASNMDTMFNALENIATSQNTEFDTKNYRVRCFAHILNLACQDILKSVNANPNPNSSKMSEVDSDSETEEVEKCQEIAVVAKLRKGIVAIRKSPQRREIFEKQCTVANMGHKNLLRDVSTRWNSTLLMLERAVLMKEPFDLTLRSIPKLRKWILDDEEWTQISSLIKILSPFKEATVMLSNEHSPTISRTSAVYQALFDHLESYTNKDNHTTSKRSKHENHTDWISTAAKRGWEKLKKYYPSSDGLVYIVGTILDPRCKLQWYKATGWPKEWIDFSRKSISEAYKNGYQSKEPVQNATASTSEDKDSDVSKQEVELFKDIFNKQMKNYQKGKGNKDDELKRYLLEGVVSPELLIQNSTGIDGALGWWKIHEKEFPTLSKMAKDFLAVSGTGVPVERLFSSGPDILTPRRQKLNAESIKMCICLKTWLQNKHNISELNQELKEALIYKLVGDFGKTEDD